MVHCNDGQSRFGFGGYGHVGCLIVFSRGVIAVQRMICMICVNCAGCVVQLGGLIVERDLHMPALSSSTVDLVIRRFDDLAWRCRFG